MLLQYETSEEKKKNSKIAHVMFAVVVFNLLFANESRELSVQSQNVIHADSTQALSHSLYLAARKVFSSNKLLQHINKIYTNLSRRIFCSYFCLINEAYVVRLSFARVLRS